MCIRDSLKTRPARSLQVAADRTSRAMAAYSWVATRNGLWVLMFLVSPKTGRSVSGANEPKSRSQRMRIPPKFRSR